MKRALAFTLAVSLACGLGSTVERGPVVTVVTGVSGMSAQDVDTSVARPMHAALASVEDVVRVESSSTDSQAELRVTFAAGAHTYQVRADIADALTRTHFPESAAIPMLLPWWDERIEVTVDTARAEGLKSALMQLPGINDVRLRGVPNRRVVAEVDPARMVASSLSVSDVLDGRHLEDVATVTVSEHSEVDVYTRGQPVAVVEILTTHEVFRPTLEEELARFEATPIGASSSVYMACPDRPTCSALGTDIAASLGATVAEATDQSARVWTDDLRAARDATASRPGVEATLQTAHSARVVASSSSDAPLGEADITHFRESLRAASGVVSVVSYPIGQPDLEVEIAPERATQLGLSTRDIAQTLQLQGGVPISLHGETLLLRWAETPVQDLPIALPSGGTVALQDVATVTLTPRSAPIYRTNGLRSHAVDVYLTGADTRLDLRSITLPDGWTADVEYDIDPL